MISDGRVHLDTDEALDRYMATMAVYAPWRLPLYRAVKARLINVVEFSREATSRDLKMLDHYKLPVIALIGDDTVPGSGPGKYPVAKRLLRHWARAAMIHSAGGEEAHYAEAVMAAGLLHRLALIETDTAHQQEWLDVAGVQPNGKSPIPVRLICLRPDAAEPHPIIPRSH